MNTKLLMMMSSAYLTIAGLALLFAPQETLSMIGIGSDTALVIVMQIFGAAYLGFAILNWAARANLIGGIYSRPVAVGNSMHFLVGAVTLVKFSFGGNHIGFWILTAIYVLFAAGFGWVTFGSPVRGPKTTQTGDS